MSSPGFMSAAQPVMLRFFKYFARSLVDGSPAADSMFDQMVELTEDWLAEHHDGELRDPHAHAALLMAMELGAFTPFLWFVKAREMVWDILEEETGARLTHSFGRIGGMANPPTADFKALCRTANAKILGLVEEGEGGCGEQRRTGDVVVGQPRKDRERVTALGPPLAHPATIAEAARRVN